MSDIETFVARAQAAQQAINVLINSRAPVKVYHPGEFLREEITNRKLTLRQVFAATGVPSGRLSEVCNGKRDVTAEMSVRLAHAFGIGDNFFLALQGAYDLYLARKKLNKLVAKLVKLP